MLPNVTQQRTHIVDRNAFVKNAYIIWFGLLEMQQFECVFFYMVIENNNNKKVFFSHNIINNNNIMLLYNSVITNKKNKSSLTSLFIFKSKCVYILSIRLLIFLNLYYYTSYQIVIPTVILLFDFIFKT